VGNITLSMKLSQTEIDDLKAKYNIALQEEKQGKPILRRLGLLEKISLSEEPSFEDIFIEALEDDDQEIIRLAINGLGGIKSKKSLQRLLKLMMKDNSDLIYNLGIAFIKINDGAVVNDIILASFDFDDIRIKYFIMRCCITILVNSKIFQNVDEAKKKLEETTDEFHHIENPIDTLENTLNNLYKISNDLLTNLQRNHEKYKIGSSVELIQTQVNQKNIFNRLDAVEVEIKDLTGKTNKLIGRKEGGVIVTTIVLSVIAILGTIATILLSIYGII